MCAGASPWICWASSEPYQGTSSHGRWWLVLLMAGLAGLLLVVVVVIFVVFWATQGRGPRDD
jgi:hypothetical protein